MADPPDPNTVPNKTVQKSVDVKTVTESNQSDAARSPAMAEFLYGPSLELHHSVGVRCL
jgi:hypothetical protein